MKKLRPHPLMMLNYLYPYLFVLIIPIVRRALSRAGRYPLVFFAETAAVVLVCLGVVLRWILCRVCLFDDKIIVKSGILFRRELIIPFKNISCVTEERSLLNALFCAVTLRIDTEAGKKGKADLFVRIYKKDIKYFQSISWTKKGQKVSVLRVILMAAATSSVGVGALVAAPFINKVGTLLDVGISELLIDTVNDANRYMSGIIPPIVNTITLVFLALYLISFVFTLAKNIFMRVYLSDKTLHIEKGMIVRRTSVFKISAVNAVIIDKAPLMRLLRRANLKISVAGYGAERGESTTLVPSLTRREGKKMLNEYFQIGDGRDKTIKADRNSEWRFLRWYIFSLFLVAVAAYIFCALFSPFKDLFVFLALVAVFLIAYLMSLAEYNFRKEYLCTSAGSLFIRVARRFSVCEMYCTKNRIGMVKLRRYPIDRRMQTCNVKIILRNENADSIALKHINYITLKEYYGFSR